MELAANIAFVLSLFCALLFVLRTCLGSLARPSIVVATHLGLALFLLMLVGLLRVWMLWLGFREGIPALDLLGSVTAAAVLIWGWRRELGYPQIPTEHGSATQGRTSTGGRETAIDPSTWLHKKIREERDFLQTIIDNTSSIIFAKTVEGRYLLINKEFEKKYQGALNDIRGKTDFDVFPRSVAEQFRQNDKVVLEKGEVYLVEEYIPHPEGVRTYFSVKFPIRDTFGRIYAIGGVATDITHIKRVEDELRRANIFLDSVIEHIPDMIFIKEAKELRFVRFNSAGENLLGISRNQVLDKNDFELFPEEQARFFIEKDRQVLEGSGYLNVEGEPIDTARRGRRYLHTQKIALRDMNGEPEFLLGISQDITEQLEAKARLEQAHLELERRVAERTDELRVVNEQLGRRLIELEEAEEKFRLAIESAPNAMVMADETGRIVLVNAEAERMFGFSREELLGKSAGSLLQDGALDLSFVLKKHAKGPNNQRIALVDDLCARRTDGKIFPIEIGLNPIAIHQGNYVLMAIVDVTDRKAAEEFMRRSLREKDLLLKEIHHRVKNNMQVISSLLKLQGSYLPNEELRRLFKQSDDRVRSMALIHERLYRSEGFDDIDFSGYIRELAEHLFHSYVMDSTRVELKLELEPTLLGIDQAIPCGLMLNEMVTNSLKHAFGVEGKGYVLIRLGNSAEGEILLQVQDNGVGLPNDFDLGRPNSFGMEIVRTLCEQLSGTLDVQGKDGTNLTLRFRRIDHPERRREFDSHSDRKGKSPLTEPLPG